MAAKLNKAAKSQKSTKSTSKSVKPVSGNNPFRSGGSYWAITETLLSYKGKSIDFATLKKGVMKSMGADGWKAFANREGRNKNAKDADGRLHQNVSVLQRDDYGKPLHDLKLEITKSKDEKRGWLYAIIRRGK